MYVIGYRGSRLPTKKALQAIVKAGHGSELDLIDLYADCLCGDEVQEGKVYAFVGPDASNRRFYGTVARRRGVLVVR